MGIFCCHFSSSFHSANPNVRLRPKLGRQISLWTEQKTYETSTPVVRTGVDPHMPIAITANSLQHWPSPSKRRPICHTVLDHRASLSHKANDRQTCYQLLTLGAYHGPKVTKLTIHLDLPSYEISVRSHKQSTRYELPKFFTFWPLGD